MYTLEELKAYVDHCQRCQLYKTRTNPVFGQGYPHADIMFIGEGPGYHEDLQGEVFVGASGQLLTKALEGIGLSRDAVYIANIIKCRAPNNRDPKPDEMETCIEFLRWQVKLIHPKIIVCLGRVAAMNVIDKNIRITRERGNWQNKNGFWMMATYHPSAVLRDPAKKRPFWEDLKSIAAKHEELCQINKGACSDE